MGNTIRHFALCSFFFMTLQTWGQSIKLGTPDGHQGLFQVLAVSENAKYLVTQGEITTKLWDVTTGKLLYDFDSCYDAAFGNNGKELLLAIRNSFEVLDIATGKIIESYPVKGDLQYCTVIKNSRYVLLYDDNTILYNAKKGKSKTYSQTAEISRYPMGGKSEMRYLGMVDDKGLRVLDLENQKWKPQISVTDLSRFSFVPGSNNVLVATKDQKLLLFDFVTGKLQSQTTTKELIKYPIFSYSDDGTFVTINNRFKGNGYLYQIGKDQQIKELLTGNTVAIAPRGNKAITTTSTPGVKGTDLILWEKKEGTFQQVSVSYTDPISSPKFSRDGRYVVTGPAYGSMLWDLSKSLKDQKPMKFGLKTAAGDIVFTPDNKLVIAINAAAGSEIREVATGKLISNFTSRMVSGYEYSAENEFGLITSWSDNTFHMWDWRSGKISHSFTGHSREIMSSQASSNGKYLLTTDSKNMRLWNANTGKELLHHEVKGRESIRSARFSANDRWVALGTSNYLILYEPETGQKAYEYKFPVSGFISVKLSHDKKYLKAYRIGAKEALLLDLSGDEPIEHANKFKTNTHISQDIQTLREQITTSGNWYEIISNGRIAQLFDASGKELISIPPSRDVRDRYFTFNRDTSLLLSYTQEWFPDTLEVALSMYYQEYDRRNDVEVILVDTLKVYQLPELKPLISIPFLQGEVTFSSTGKYLVTDSHMEGTDEATHMRVVSVMNDQYEFLDKQTPKDQYSKAVVFNKDDSRMVVRSEETILDVWDMKSNKLLSRQDIIKSLIKDIRFLNNDQYLLATSKNGHSLLIDATTGELLLEQFFIDNNPKLWVHIRNRQLFDASDEAMDLMYWVKGDEPIEFSQLKDRFWVPGLWEKVIKKEALPEKLEQGLNNIELYPRIKLLHPDYNGNKLGIKLYDQGGGYGAVKVHINGKEVSEDIRGGDFDHSQDSVSLSYDITGHPFLIGGELNTIEVTALNASGYVVSRPHKIYIFPEKEATYQPTLHAIIVGTSDYLGTSLDLNFPAKDATAFANSLELAAKNMLGTDRTNFKVLISGAPTDQRPSKQNIQKAFEELAAKAKPKDALVMYFAGHGANYTGEDVDFYYITEAAANVTLKDPEIRKSIAISSSELTDWIKQIPALKQVMIFDACHSGQFAEDLMTQRDTRNASEVKALDRMKGRTGTYILSGSAADAVSYEASIYGQGLLTYALLFGMKGASLRDNKFVDVVQLFQFAADKVPQLAENIGGIQKPEIRIPKGGESFDIGLLDASDRAKISLPNPKPLFVRSAFQNETTFDDNLDLTEKCNEQLRQAQLRDSKIVFVDVSRFTSAYAIKGRYESHGNIIKLKANLIKDGAVVKAFSLESSDLELLMEELTGLVVGEVGRGSF